MAKSKELTPGEVRELGEATWVVASDYAAKNGLGVTKKGNSGHLVTVKGGVSKFIREAAKQAGLIGYVDKGDDATVQRRRVREFLKEGYNVVVIGKGDGPYEWRLFVADDWSKDGTVPQSPHVISRAVSNDVDRLTDGESGPVESVNLWEEFQTHPVGEVQARILKWLYENGGKYTDKSGFALNDVLPDATEGDSNSGSFKSLEDRGLTKRQMKNQRRWAVAALTQRGWWSAENLSYIQTAEVALAKFLSTVGSFEGTSPQHTITELSERVHKNRSEVGRVLLDMEDKGWVELQRDSENSPYRSVKWVAGPIELPGVHIGRTQDRTTMVPVTHDPKANVSVPAEDAPPVARDSGPSLVRSDILGPLTEEYAKLVVQQLLDTAKGPDPDKFKSYQQTIEHVYAMCKDVEAGKMSALRAVTEILDVTGDALS